MSEGNGRLQANAYQRSDAGQLFRQLPGALTEAGLTFAISELPVGARLAAETVFKCWGEGKFADVEFVSFLQSISAYSPALMQMVCGPAQGTMTGVRAMPVHGISVHGIPVQGIPMHSNKVPFASTGGSSATLAPAVPQIPPGSEAAMGINKEWRTRRRQEAARRQCAGIDGTEREQRGVYLCRIFSYFRRQLPASAKPLLLNIMVGYSHRQSGSIWAADTGSRRRVSNGGTSRVHPSTALHQHGMRRGITRHQARKR